MTTILLVAIGIVVGVIVGAVAMAYYIGREMFRNW
jgi:uncharacterized membrane-anchored protein YhcB (DUF1043 family)